MDVTLNAKIRRVGNSLALFIPSKAGRQLGLKPNEEVAATIAKKKNKSAIWRLFGAARGRKMSFVEGDRLDVRQ